MEEEMAKYNKFIKNFLFNRYAKQIPHVENEEIENIDMLNLKVKISNFYYRN